MPTWTELVSAHLPTIDRETFSGSGINYRRTGVAFSLDGNSCEVTMTGLEIEEAARIQPYTIVFNEACRIAGEVIPLLAKQEAITGFNGLWERAYSREVQEPIEKAQVNLTEELVQFKVRVEFGSVVSSMAVDLPGYYRRAHELAKTADPNQVVLILDISSYKSDSRSKRNNCQVYPYLVDRGKPVLTSRELVQVQDYTFGTDQTYFKKETKEITIDPEGYSISFYSWSSFVIPGVQLSKVNNSISRDLSLPGGGKSFLYSDQGSYPERMEPIALNQVIGCFLIDKLEIEWEEKQKLRKQSDGLSDWSAEREKDSFWQSLESAAGVSLGGVRRAIGAMDVAQGSCWRERQKAAAKFGQAVSGQEIDSCGNILMAQFIDQLTENEWLQLGRVHRVSRLAIDRLSPQLAIKCLSCGLQEIITDPKEAFKRDEESATEYRTHQANPGYSGRSLCDAGVPIEKRKTLAGAGCGARNSTNPFANTSVRVNFRLSELQG